MACLLYLLSKEREKVMKKMILFALIAFFTVDINNATAQEKLTKKEQRKLEKEARKKEEQKMLKKQKEAYYSIVQDSNFIIEANTITTDNRDTYQVIGDLNFFMIEGDKFVLQTGNAMNIGLNGVGGITIDGRILEYEVEKGKEGKPIRINANVTSTVLGHSIVNITIFPNGRGTARLRDNRGNEITFMGNTYSVDGSTAFEGQSIY